MKKIWHIVEDIESNDLLSFKKIKGRFNRAQALEVKRELRRLAHT